MNTFLQPMALDFFFVFIRQDQLAETQPYTSLRPKSALQAQVSSGRTPGKETNLPPGEPIAWSHRSRISPSQFLSRPLPVGWPSNEAQHDHG